MPSDSCLWLERRPTSGYHQRVEGEMFSGELGRVALSSTVPLYLSGGVLSTCFSDSRYTSQISRTQVPLGLEGMRFRMNRRVRRFRAECYEEKHFTAIFSEVVIRDFWDHMGPGYTSLLCDMPTLGACVKSLSHLQFPPQQKKTDNHD